MHPFRDDRRSKSIEEREEEYQRVRDRIFAHDVSSCFNCLFSVVLPSASSKAASFPRQRAGRDEGSWSSGDTVNCSKLQVFLEEAWVQRSEGEGARVRACS